MDRASVLMYHMVTRAGSAQERRYACHPSLFRKQIGFLRANGYNIVSLPHLIALLDSDDPVPPRTLTITFDDGFQDNYTEAFPILQEYALPATIFVATEFVGRTNRWMEADGYPSRAMLSWSQIEEMAGAGITIGSHTVSHARLTQIPAQLVDQELRHSKAELEDRLARAVDYFAYPYGLYSSKLCLQAKEVGYLAACSTRSGFNNRSTDRFALHRLEVTGTDSIRAFRQKLTFGTNDARWDFPLKYYARRLRARF